MTEQPTTAAQPLDLALSRDAFISTLTYDVYKAEIADLTAQARAAQPVQAGEAVDERALFEAWAGIEYRNASYYTSLEHDIGWAAWQARGRSLASKPEVDRVAFENYCDDAIDGSDTVSRDWLFHFCTNWQARATLAPVAAQQAAAEQHDAKLQAAIQWINTAQHGDNCFVSDHYPGDPGNRCNCGKDSLLQYLESDEAKQ